MSAKPNPKFEEASRRADAEIVENTRSIRSNLEQLKTSAERSASKMRGAEQAIADVDALCDRHLQRLDDGDDELTPIDGVRIVDLQALNGNGHAKHHK